MEHIMLRSAGRREVRTHKAPADELQKWLDSQKAQKSRSRTTFGIISLVIQHLRSFGKHSSLLGISIHTSTIKPIRLSIATTKKKTKLRVLPVQSSDESAMAAPEDGFG